MGMLQKDFVWKHGSRKHWWERRVSERGRHKLKIQEKLILRRIRRNSFTVTVETNWCSTPNTAYISPLILSLIEGGFERTPECDSHFLIQRFSLRMRRNTIRWWRANCNWNRSLMWHWGLCGFVVWFVSSKLWFFSSHQQKLFIMFSHWMSVNIVYCSYLVVL